MGVDMYSLTLRYETFPCEMWQLYTVAEELYTTVQDKKWGSVYPVEFTMQILDTQKEKSQEYDLQKGMLNCRNVPYIVHFSYSKSPVIFSCVFQKSQVVDTVIERPKRPPSSPSLGQLCLYPSSLSNLFWEPPVMEMPQPPQKVIASFWTILHWY